MTSSPTIRRSTVASASQRTPCGTTAIEVLVALSLLGTVLTAVTPLVVHHTRLLATQRHYRLALDELSNQLELLTSLPEGRLPEAMEGLTPSSMVARCLAEVELHGELAPAELGQRLVLRITWSDSPGRTTSVSLAAWVIPDTTQRGDQLSEDTPS